MGGLFSKGKRRKRRADEGGVSDADRAVLDLKNARDGLRAFQVKLEAEAATLTATARSLLAAGKRDRALLAVRTRRFREAKVAEIDAQLLTLEQTTETLEFTARQRDVVAAIRSGTDALKELQSGALSLASVEALMDETADALEIERGVSAALANGVGADVDDDAELAAELAALEAAAETVDAAAIDAAFPDAPSTAVEAAAPVAGPFPRLRHGVREEVREAPKRAAVSA